MHVQDFIQDEAKQWFLRGNQAKADNNINLLLIATACYDTHIHLSACTHSCTYAHFGIISGTFKSSVLHL